MKIIECPRDAIQGIKNFIPTKNKIIYINQLLKVGFDTIDFGSFVSNKIIPQLKDTSEVLDGLHLDNTSSKLLAIVANKRGSEEACSFPKIDYVGFPLSVCEEFQRRNTNKSIEQSLRTIEDIQHLTIKHDKKLVIYLSMAFGNPYGEDYHPDIVAEIINRLNNLEIEIIALSDTTGISDTNNISLLFNTLISEYNKIEFGAHFHSTPDKCIEKIESAYQNGCRRFDATIKGYGGCPMAKDKLTGNIPTEKLISFLRHKKLTLNISEFNSAVNNFEKIILNRN